MLDHSGPAFPSPTVMQQLVDGRVQWTHGEPVGMSLRDWYAGLAMQSLVLAVATSPTYAEAVVGSVASGESISVEAHAAEVAAGYADAMITYRNNREADGDGNGDAIPGS